MSKRKHLKQQFWDLINDWRDANHYNDRELDNWIVMDLLDMIPTYYLEEYIDELENTLAVDDNDVDIEDDEDVEDQYDDNINYTFDDLDDI